MSKIHRGDPQDGEPLSAGRVEYLEQARQRVRGKRIRRTALVVIVLAVIVAFTTGFVGSSITWLKDVVDTVQIALRPAAGWPQQTGIQELTALEPMSGSFVELGSDGCVVYSLQGDKLNSIQSGYARPAIAVGKNRFVLYNRSGNELRVESRTQNLYTKTMENSIYLCAMAEGGQLAVVTDDVNSMAMVTVFSNKMDQLLTWSVTSAEGVPLRMKFSPDSSRLALANVTSDSGQLTANLYVLSLSQGEPVNIGSAASVPQWLGWLSNDTVLAIYEDRAVLYGANGSGEKASYDFGGSSLVSVSQEDSGMALLLSAGQVCSAVLLDRNLNVQYAGNVLSAHKIVRANGKFYLLTDSTVECFAQSGEFQWNQVLSTRPQGLVTSGKQLLVLSGNTVQVLTPPEQSASSQ